MNAARRLAVALIASAMLAGPMVSSASADDTNPPPGDQESWSPTATKSATEAAAASAVLEVMMNCMKKQGEVPQGTLASVVLGDVSSTGVETPPTGTAVQPSQFCASNGTYTVEQTVLSAPELTLTKDLSNLERNAAQGLDVMPTTGWTTGGGTGGTGGTGGGTTRAASAAPSVDAKSGPQMAIASTTSNKRYWTNRRGLVNSNSAFMTYRFSPSYLIWSTDECSAPRVIGNGPYGFRNSCIRHDFNYRNLKSLGAFSRPNKARADTKFESDMIVRCASAYSGWTRTRCYSLAGTYGAAVRTFQWPNTVGYRLGGSYTW